MVPRQRRVVSIIATARTAGAEFSHQRQLPRQATSLLRGVALMMVIGVFVLAPARAVLPLSPAKWFTTDTATQLFRHMFIIISQLTFWSIVVAWPTIGVTGL